MKARVKKTLASLFMLVCMVVCMMPVQAKAAEATGSTVYFQIMYNETVVDGTKITMQWVDADGNPQGEAVTTSNGKITAQVSSEDLGLKLRLDMELPEGYRFASQEATMRVEYAAIEFLTGETVIERNLHVEGPEVDNSMLLVFPSLLNIEKGLSFDISGATDESGTDLQIFHHIPDGARTRVYCDTIRVTNEEICHISEDGKTLITDKIGCTTVEFVVGDRAAKMEINVVEDLGYNCGGAVLPEPTGPSKPSAPADKREETTSTTANGATVSQKNVIQSDLNDVQKNILGVYFTDMQNIDNDTTLSAEQKQEKKAASVQTMINNVLGLNLSYKKGVYATYELTASDLSQPLPIVVDGIKAGDKVVVAHLRADGSWENVTVSEVADGVVYAKFDSLSPVFVAAVNGSAGATSPKTGDTGMNMVLFFVGMAAVCSAVVYTKRRMNAAR